MESFKGTAGVVNAVVTKLLILFVRHLHGDPSLGILYIHAAFLKPYHADIHFAGYDPDLIAHINKSVYRNRDIQNDALLALCAQLLDLL